MHKSDTVRSNQILLEVAGICAQLNAKVTAELMPFTSQGLAITSVCVIQDREKEQKREACMYLSVLCDLLHGFLSLNLGLFKLWLHLGQPFLQLGNLFCCAQQLVGGVLVCACECECVCVCVCLYVP